MIIIAGLGNPTKEYEGTRHNVGFQVIDKIAEKYNIAVDAKKGRAYVGKGIIEGQKVLLVKPQTYMNLSGEAVRELINYYKMDAETELVVIYDDIDLPASRLRVRKSGSAGTHNGMRSIIAHTPGQNFPRVRVGVGAKPDGWDLADWVLSKYTIREEQIAMQQAFERAADCVEDWVKNGIDHAMQEYNKTV